MISLLLILIVLLSAIITRNKVPTLKQFDRRGRLYGLVNGYYYLVQPVAHKAYRYRWGKVYLRYIRLCFDQSDHTGVLALLISQALLYATAGLALAILLIQKNVGPLVEAMSIVSIFLLAGLPFVQLRRNYKEMSYQIIRALPTFVHQIAMLMRSGATVEASVYLIFNRLDQHHALYKILNKVHLARERGEHLSDAFGVMPELLENKEIHHLALLMSQVSRSGVYQFAEQLMELGDLIIRDRQTVVKTISEQLSTKLLMPLMVSMMTLMAILVYPILSQF